MNSVTAFWKLFQRLQSYANPLGWTLLNFSLSSLQTRADFMCYYWEMLAIKWRLLDFWKSTTNALIFDVICYYPDLRSLFIPISSNHGSGPFECSQLDKIYIQTKLFTYIQGCTVRPHVAISTENLHLQKVFKSVLLQRYLIGLETSTNMINHKNRLWKFTFKLSRWLRMYQFLYLRIKLNKLQLLKKAY